MPSSRNSAFLKSEFPKGDIKAKLRLAIPRDSINNASPHQRSGQHETRIAIVSSRASRVMNNPRASSTPCCFQVLNGIE